MAQEKMTGKIADTSSVIKNFDKMGIESSEYLNNHECEYFKKIFKDFDFEGKKICFLGPGRLVLSDKQKYFKSLKENNFFVHSDLYVFNEFEKEESGGYDAVIVYWNKRNYMSKDLIKRLKEKR